MGMPLILVVHQIYFLDRYLPSKMNDIYCNIYILFSLLIMGKWSRPPSLYDIKLSGKWLKTVLSGYLTVHDSSGPQGHHTCPIMSLCQTSRIVAVVYGL